MIQEQHQPRKVLFRLDTWLLGIDAQALALSARLFQFGDRRVKAFLDDSC